MLPKYILLANHWYDCFPINTLIHLFLPFFFDVLTLDVETHSLPKMLVTNQLTCSNTEERRSHLLWFTLIWYIVNIECFNEINHVSLISNINMVEGWSQWCAISGVGVWPLACWNCEFESCQGHGCLYLASIVCCQVEGVGLITHPEESYWVLCVWVWLWNLDIEETQGC